MAIAQSIDALPAQLWPQGDIRDPLGLWGCRLAITGDASGGSIKTTVNSATGQDAAYVYTAYAATITVVTGTPTTIRGKVRLLTNWPNVDVQPGVQAFATIVQPVLEAGSVMTSPNLGPSQPLVGGNDRFLLLFDPRPTAGQIQIMELEINENVLAKVYSFEAYGYFWDRSVLQAPGGLRHPGAS